MCASVLGWLLSEAPFNFCPQYLRPWACTAFFELLGLVLGLKPLGQWITVVCNAQELFWEAEAGPS